MEHLTSESFKERIFDYVNSQDWSYKGEKPCIIDFYAEWCGPCKIVAPVLEDLSKEYTGKIDIYKVDTDKEQELSSIFGIQSVPSILFIPITGQPQMAAGAIPKSGFKEAIKTIFNID